MFLSNILYAEHKVEMCSTVNGDLHSTVITVWRIFFVKSVGMS